MRKRMTQAQAEALLKSIRSSQSSDRKPVRDIREMEDSVIIDRLRSESLSYMRLVVAEAFITYGCHTHMENRTGGTDMQWASLCAQALACMGFKVNMEVTTDDTGNIYATIRVSY